VFLVLPEDLAAAMQSSVKNAEPQNSAIKQYFADGKTIDGAEVKRLFHLRVS
jgi:hypothetical protein